MTLTFCVLLLTFPLYLILIFASHFAPCFPFCLASYFTYFAFTSFFPIFFSIWFCRFSSHLLFIIAITFFFKSTSWFCIFLIVISCIFPHFYSKYLNIVEIRKMLKALGDKWQKYFHNLFLQVFGNITQQPKKHINHTFAGKNVEFPKK